MKEYPAVKIMHGVLGFVFFFNLAMLYKSSLVSHSYSKRIVQVAACDSLWSDLVPKPCILMASDLINGVSLLY